MKSCFITIWANQPYTRIFTPMGNLALPINMYVFGQWEATYFNTERSSCQSCWFDQIFFVNISSDVFHVMHQRKYFSAMHHSPVMSSHVAFMAFNRDIWSCWTAYCSYVWLTDFTIWMDHSATWCLKKWILIVSYEEFDSFVENKLLIKWFLCRFEENCTYSCTHGTKPCNLLEWIRNLTLLWVTS